MGSAAPKLSTPARIARRKLVIRGAVAAVALLGIATGIYAARGALVTASAATSPYGMRPALASGSADPITGPFSRFALNALLVPLLDDNDPPHWTDVALHHFCGPATRVDINGQPLVPGTPIPATAFTVRWHIDQCWPLDYAAFELSGRVDLLVFHDDAGLSAVVSAQRLRISTAKGAGQMSEPFAASMATGVSALQQDP